MIIILMGWTYRVDVLKTVPKCVLIMAPHTSAWDLVIGKSIFVLANIPARIAIKKEAFFWPMNWLLRYLGGTPIDRTPKAGSKQRISLVDAMANTIKREKKICLVITPEGSRGKRKQWKTGFYYVALKAEVPIALGYMDFSTKEGVVDNLFYPTGNLDADMREIMNFYRDKIELGEHPNRSVLDERWS
jgi:1-acyl-sn-glycerol-3-phosphate acyltransferase